MTAQVSVSTSVSVPTFGEFRKTKPRKLNKFIKNQGFSQVARGQGAASGGSHTQHVRDGKKVTLASHDQQLLKKGTAKSIYKRVVQGEASSADGGSGGDKVSGRGPLEAVTSVVVNRPVSPQSQAVAPLVAEDTDDCSITPEQEASTSDVVGLTIERPVTAPPVLEIPPPSQPPREERIPDASETAERPRTAPSALETLPPSDPQREETAPAVEETGEKPKKALAQTFQGGDKTKNQKKQAKRKAARQAAKQQARPAVHPSFMETRVADVKTTQPKTDVRPEPQPWETSDVGELANKIMDVQDLYAGVKKALAGPESSNRAVRGELQRLKIKLEFDAKKLVERFVQLYREGKVPAELIVAMGLV